METSYKINAQTDEYEIVLKGTRQAAIAALRVLCDEGIIECDHEITETVGVDDTRWFDASGHLQERSNPDIERCEICGKYYYPEVEEWRDE